MCGNYTGCIFICCYDISEWNDEIPFQLNIGIPDSIAKSSLKRRSSYLAGRFVADIALRNMGIENFPILSGSSREPIWPAHICGSLSHSDKNAVCALHHARMNGGVGIDIEKIIPEETAEQIWSVIINGKEKEMLENIPTSFSFLLTIVFSAKESLFKALYPIVKVFFGFEEANIIDCNIKDQSFTLELTSSLSCNVPAKSRFKGHFVIYDDSILTLIYF